MSEGKYICKENKDAMVEALESAEEIIKRSRIISDPLKEPNYRLIVAQVAIALFNESNYTS